MKKKKKPLKNKECNKDIIIRILQEEIRFCHLEISRLETANKILKMNDKNHELRGWGVINGDIRSQLRDITVGQYTAPKISCQALRRSKDTNR